MVESTGRPSASSMETGRSSSSSSIDHRPQKRPGVAGSVDRLSDLPDPLVCHILSLLPTKTVVATSTLATRWKSLWTKVTSVDVSFHQICGSDPDVRTEMGTRFTQIVNKVLLFQKAELLDKFHLNWLISSRQEADSVRIWLSYAIARNLRSCSLSLGRKMPEVNLPGTLFTCKTLESLKLFGVFTLQVLSLVCLPKLQVLSLRFLCHGSDESIHKLISGCPVLHSLTIERVDEIDIDLKISSLSLRRLYVCHIQEPDLGSDNKKLEIDAPNLEFLHLNVRAYDCSIKCPGASLNEAILELGKNVIAGSYADFVNGADNGDCDSTVKLVETLNRVKCLSLLGFAMMGISHADIPLSTRFERLTKLDIDVPCCEWSSLSVMLGCCSRLQLFSIRVFRFWGDHTHKRCWKDPEQVPECLLSSLARVSFELFKGLEDEMSIIRYFMKHGSVLVSFDVRADPSVSDNKFQMLQAIAEFPRLSSACSLKFA